MTIIGLTSYAPQGQASLGERIQWTHTVRGTRGQSLRAIIINTKYREIAGELFGGARRVHLGIFGSCTAPYDVSIGE